MKGTIDMPDTPDRAQFWSDYYAKLAAAESLDYSNDKVQAETFGFALAAAGPIAQKRCLDFACGRGRLAMALDALGGDVTGVDFMPEFIALNAARSPSIRWRAGTLPDATLEAELGTFDVVFALEVLQLMDFATTLERLWTVVRAGGRLVVLVPNRDCPIVVKTMARFDGRYEAPTTNDVTTAFAALANVDAWGIRGMHFLADQRIAPYDITPQTMSPSWEVPPNRLLAVATKRG